LRALDLRALLEALNERGVDFIVVGGVAVAAHGYVRATEDLDIVPEPSAQNLERLARTLADLEAVLPTAGGRAFEPAGDLAALKRHHNLTADTRYGGLDVVQRVPVVPSFATLAEEAVDAELLGTPVRVCSLAHLRQMKEATGRTQDRADLEKLPES
jgi:hypothetical protein